MAAPLAQPNIPAITAAIASISVALGNIAQEVALFPNMPAFAGSAQLAALQEQLTTLTATVNTNQATIMAALNAHINLSNMRQKNILRGLDGHLIGPMGPLAGPIINVSDVLGATSVQLDALNATLGDVEGYPVGGPIAQKRLVIGDFLGIAIPL